ncbi:MAG: hypothetical protein Q9161_004652 [Pseudevernia consocians]
MSAQGEIYAEPNVSDLSDLSNIEASAFYHFKSECEANGLLARPKFISPDDLCDGINDDVTLLFLKFYENVEVVDYEETRKLFMAWTGRRDKRGLPICLFDMKYLTSNLEAYKKSCDSLSTSRATSTGLPSAVTLRSLAVFEGMVRFVLPLCSLVRARPSPETPIFQATIIADISAVSLMQIWRIRSWFQSNSKILADAYPEILDRVIVIGAPSYLPTLWKWAKDWIDPVTASKLMILKEDQVLPTLASYIDVANIPKKYGGEHGFEHGMQPDLDPAINGIIDWLAPCSGSFPAGPMKLVFSSIGMRLAEATGSIDGTQRTLLAGIVHPDRLVTT